MPLNETPLGVGDAFHALHHNIITNQPYGYGVLSGVAPSQGTNALDVDLAAGSVAVGHTAYSISSQTVTLDAHSSDPRKDVIYVDNTGAVSVAKGDPSPIPPDQAGASPFQTVAPPPKSLQNTEAAVIAEVWVPASDADVLTVVVNDIRISPSYDQIQIGGGQFQFNYDDANDRLQILDADGTVVTHWNQNQTLDDLLENNGPFELSVQGLSGDLADPQDPKTHGSSHENGNADEISVQGLSGDLADAQDPKAHSGSHAYGGSDTIDAGSLGGSGGADGEVLTTDGAQASWGDVGGSVEASTTDDGSDITIFRSEDVGPTTIVNSSVAGTLLGGWSIRGSGPHALDFTVDGGTTWRANAVQEPNQGVSYISMPSIQYQSSLTIDLVSTDSYQGTYSAIAYVKQ